MPAWTFFLADRAGANLAELTTAQGRTLTYQRNWFPEAQLQISHDDDAAALLLAAVPNGGARLKAYRTDRDGVTRLKFNGYLAPFDEALEEAAALNLTFRGPFSRLLGDGQTPGRFTAASVSFAQLDAGQIAKQLIDGTAPVGINTTGTIEPTKPRDRTYEYANIGEAIIALTNVIDGFDFEVIPLAGPDIGQLLVYASQGGPQPGARFEYGPDTLHNVAAVGRQTVPPRNVARILGANGLVGLATDQASIDLHGEWWIQEQQADISDQATLNARAAAALRPSPTTVVSFTPDPAIAPSPWDDYWLGDAVAFYGKRGAFVQAAQLRVSLITVVIDDEGNEAAQIDDPATAGGTLTANLEGELVD